MEQSFRKRMEFIIHKAGGPDALARKSQLSRRVVDKYKAEDSEPSMSRLVALAEAAGVSVHWLATGQGDPEAGPGELAPLPVMNVRASAGTGALVFEEEQRVGQIAFDPAWLYHGYGLHAADLFVLPSFGDSMEPTIPAGCYILCSRSLQHLKVSDGIYVFRLDDMILVKRLQPLPGQILRVSSDNDAYEPFQVDMKTQPDLTILGRIMIILRRV